LWVCTKQFFAVELEPKETGNSLTCNWPLLQFQVLQIRSGR